MVDVRILLSILGSVITLAIFVIGITFKTGHLSARVEELERWRNGIRMDMHEISDKLESLKVQITGLSTLIEERTERRVHEREEK